MHHNLNPLLVKNKKPHANAALFEIIQYSTVKVQGFPKRIVEAEDNMSELKIIWFYQLSWVKL